MYSEWRLRDKKAALFQWTASKCP